MRQLSPAFVACLQTGFLAELVRAVREDGDLDLEIRAGYLNIYFKGNSLLKLAEVSPRRYRVEVNAKFAGDLPLPPALTDAATTAAFVAEIPRLKQAIVRHGASSLEIEYEQLIIRANNLEPRNASEYFIVDRQYPLGGGRFDLTGIFWDRGHRRRNQVADPCLIEVKFALNADISAVDEQLARYYAALRPAAAEVAAECESILRQKLELGLYAGPPERLEAMQTLTVAREISRFQFVLFLVDYNPYSARLDLTKIARLPFADQVRVCYGGMAMWQQNVQPVDGPTAGR